MRVMILGEAPSKRIDPSRPLSGTSGMRLAGLLGFGHIQLAEHFDLANLFPKYPGSSDGKGDAFPIELARAHARNLLPKLCGRRVILLGRRLARAFELVQPMLEWHESLGVEMAIFPHPSGINRWWNDLGNVEKAACFLRSTLGVES